MACSNVNICLWLDYVPKDRNSQTNNIGLWPQARDDDKLKYWPVAAECMYAMSRNIQGIILSCGLEVPTTTIRV